MPWDIASVLSEAIRTAEPERPLIRRDYIYASELGYDFASRYLAMYAHVPSNPPNDRSEGKFLMGKLMEAIIGIVLTVTGILRHHQLRGETNLKGLLRVSGKLDYIAGGSGIDWDEAESKVKIMQQFFAMSAAWMPKFIFNATDKVLAHFKNVFSNVPMEKYIYEIKSVSGMVFDIIEATHKARHHHILQSGHYLISDKESVDATKILYWSRDDARMEEMKTEATKDFLKLYKSDVATMTGYYNEGIGRNYLKHIPPLAPEVHFLEGSWRFEKNMNVQYSRYLTFLYGYKNFDAFKERWAAPLTSFNRVFKRHVNEGKEITRTKKDGTVVKSVAKLTAANIEIIKEAKKIFHDWDKFVNDARKSGAFQTQEENEDE